MVIGRPSSAALQQNLRRANFHGRAPSYASHDALAITLRAENSMYTLLCNPGISDQNIKMRQQNQRV